MGRGYGWNRVWYERVRDRRKGRGGGQWRGGQWGRRYGMVVGGVGYGRRGLEVERMVGEGNGVEGMEW